MSPDEILSRVLYRDGMMLIIDKPAGLPVHAGPGGGANLEQFLDPLRFGLPQAPHLAHRLDRDTSGCLILGRHRKALSRLGKMFAAGRVQKTYWAVVHGVPDKTSGRIDLPLAKIQSRGGWHMKVEQEKGQKSVTDWRLAGQGEGYSWLELYPRTGRTHQIRVHCAALGLPLVGDPVYGPPGDAGIPMHLHARAIKLSFYESKDPVEAIAPVPAHMRDKLLGLGYVD